MENQKLFDLVKEALGDCDRSDIVDAWNEICSDDDTIYSMNAFDDVCDAFNDLSPTDIIKCVNEDFDDFNFHDDFFYIDYGSYYSTDDPFDAIDEDRLVAAILEDEVEIDGIDLDELKKQCGELRPFKTKEEFKQETGLSVGSQIIIRSKESGAVVEAAITSFCTLNSSTIIGIGVSAHNFDELFNTWEYQKNDEWKPFGIADETTDSANATSEE